MKKEEIEEIAYHVMNSMRGDGVFPPIEMTLEYSRRLVAEVQKRQEPECYMLDPKSSLSKLTGYNKYSETKQLDWGIPLFTFPPAEQKCECKVPEGYALLNVDELRGLTYSFDGRDKLETMLAAAPKPPEYSE